MAQRVQQQYNRTLITFVEDENASLVTDTVEIIDGFRGFYQKSYTSQCTTDQDDISAHRLKKNKRRLGVMSH